MQIYLDTARIKEIENKNGLIKLVNNKKHANYFKSK